MKNKHISLNKYVGLIILIVMMIISSLLDRAFLTPNNLINILRQVSIVTILAFGETMLIIGGQLDLSVGTNAAMSGTFACIVYIATQNLLVALLTGMALGALVGIVNGFVVTKFNAPPFIVTLAMQQITTGIIFLYTDGQNVYKIGDFRVFGQGAVGPVPTPVIIMLIVGVIAFIILRYMKFGRYLYAIGGNQNAAIASGVRVKSVLLRAYIISGVLAGLGGVVLMSRLNAGLPASGAGMETDALTATIIGGTSFTGGIGTAPGTLVGACVIGVLNNIMNLIGVPAYVQMILKGALIIIAVVIDIYGKQNKRTVRILEDKETGSVKEVS